MFRLPFASVPVCAAALMSGGVCSLQLNKTRKGLMIEHAAYAGYPDGLWLSGKVTDWQACSQVMADAVSGCKVRSVATCISVIQAHVKTLQVPASFSAEEIETEIVMQLMRGVAGKRYELFVDFAVQQRLTDEYMQVLCVAARADYVNQLRNSLMVAGLTVSRVDIDLFALIRAVRFLDKNIARSKNFGLLYLDEKGGIFAGCEPEALLFHQSRTEDSPALESWLDRVCHAYQRYQLDVIVLLVPLSQFGAAEAVIRRYWTCSVYRLVADAKINCDQRAEQVLKDYPESLVALGLALGEVGDEF